MNRELLQTVVDFLGPALVLTTLFFFYQKAYYHLKYIRLHSPELKSRSMTGLIVDPYTILRHIYVLIPIFIKSDKKKKGEELILESKTARSLLMFWLMFGLTIVLSMILTGLINKSI